MHFWGMTIDTVSCNMLVIAIGLCVDYSAHIGKQFLITKDQTKSFILQLIDSWWRLEV